VPPSSRAAGSAAFEPYPRINENIISSQLVITESPEEELDSPSDAAALPAQKVDTIGPPPKTTNEKQTAKLAITILTELDHRFKVPGRAERDALLVGFAMRRKVLYGAAFDVVRVDQKVDLTDPKDISEKIECLTAYEIKSTNKTATRGDFGGYFFDLTTAELLVAQSLGDRYRFAFVNTLTRTWMDMTLNDVFAKARKIYPKWAISF
jgi:hypothetical protein